MKVSIDRIRKSIEELCRFENRIAGTKTERKAADYLKGLLSDIGFDVKEHEFPVISWEPQESTMTLVEPDKMQVDCALFPNSPSVDQRVMLVPLESKREKKTSELPHYAIEEWGESLYASPNIPYNKAVDLGLDGLVISSPDEGELLKVRVGIQGKQLEIPIFSVSKESGEILRKMMEESEVILDIKSIAKRGPSKSINLEAILEGSNPDFDIIVSAHYDAWFSGASDNAAPAAIVMETARQLWKYVQQGGTLRRTIRFLLYGAEESGSERFYYWLNGSRDYVEKQENLRQFALVVNLDSIGYNATNYVATTYDLLNFAQSISTATKQEERMNHFGPPADGSDHWFFTLGGVPTIYLISWPSHLYHTQKDIPDFLDFESIQGYAEYTLHSVMEFSNAGMLPIDVIALLEVIKERIKEFNMIDGNPFDLEEVSDLLVRILEFEDALDQFSQNTIKVGNEENIAKLNDFLLTTAGKINQTIGQVSEIHVANYLARLELIEQYLRIDSAIQTLEAMTFMKIHPRTLASLGAYDDVPNKLVDVANAINELRLECNRLVLQINKEIEDLKDSLTEIQTDLETLLP